MAKRISDEALRAIEQAVGAHPDGVSLREIAETLTPPVPPRTLQYRLKHLVDKGRLVTEGERRRWAKYRLAPKPEAAPPSAAEGEEVVPLSPESLEIRKYLGQPIAARKPVGYNRAFLDSYKPNVSAYLLPAERQRLAAVGKPNVADQAAGTYAKQILNRLLIDLSWNSSRLEGNTYSLLDTKRLIEFGEEAAGRDRLEAQMIVNHKEAIAFLVGAAEEIGFNRYTILNLHGILAHNLLPDEAAAGRLRHIAVGIEKSTFHPLELPQRIDECFNQLLATAAAIEDPFEQALFAMVQLPYLQPFDDVNKRVSRLAANIPFIKQNLSPLSFTDVPRSLYTDAILGVYELNRVDLLKDVFIWAYERSAARYAAVRQSLGEPDPFRFKHSAALKQVVSEVIRGEMDRRAAAAHIASWAEKNVSEPDRGPFREMAEGELLSLHEGNFARYQIRPSEFSAWQAVWADGAPPSALA
ncbi:MAG: Fic family protein [Acidobacteriota bacterium]|nr:Fic family protein [Acidobacteriota bacterium]